MLLDLRMPGMDGQQVLETVAADPNLNQRHAFVLVTANDRTLPLAFVNVLTALHVTVLGKPFDLDALLAEVAAATERL